MILPEPIQRLIEAFSKLPGIGPKTASRLSFYLLRSSEDLARELGEALYGLRSGTAFCQTCFNITVSGRQECEVCTSTDRDGSVICVVEEPLDVLALERTSGYSGKYHVLHGVLSPIEGVSPEDLKISELLDRVGEGEIREVILATNPSLEGDATAMYLSQKLQSLGVKTTRLARGLPVGGDLEYADPNTLLRALAGRHEMN
ncbi:MAG: recombination protein RecR [Anaerolineales bacterium]|nr:MAG: recombination protein RecR [Anaerolineales bacterium]